MSWAAEREKEMKKKKERKKNTANRRPWCLLHALATSTFAKIRPLVFSRVTITAFALPAKRSDKTT